jgi:hypothetical protein
MTLDDQDWEKMEKLLDKKLNNVGKRVTRLETGFNLTARFLRMSVVETAKEKHDHLLRAMFSESSLLVLSPLVEGTEGKVSRPTVSCSLTDVTDVFDGVPELGGGKVKYEIEATDTGFRLLMASWSPQTRRKAAASFIKHGREPLQKQLGLYLQYDKPYELRMMQREAYKFLAVLQKRGGAAIQGKELNKGFVVVNGVRLAPEYLVPGPRAWDKLADNAVEKLRTARGRAQPPEGIMTDVFGFYFAADKGVVDLEEVVVEDDMSMDH